MGALTLLPEDVFTLEGATVTLRCGSNKDDVIWWTLRRPGVAASTSIFQGRPDGDVVITFKSRFSADQSAGFADQKLIIKNVTMDDAGLYECIDEAGFGQGTNRTASANLVVIRMNVPLLCSVSLKRTN